MAHKLFSYRPGLDGIRGGGMIVFMLWHVGALTVLPGLWVFMNVFFVLSAFLITRLLLAEWRTYGSISPREFYVRRIRRLAPALLVMLTAVTVDGVFFAPATETRYLRGDIVATLAYVMNWRLVWRGDQYFEGFTHPSITRHAWSLSVEEQFYLFVPFLVMAVLMFLRRRSTRTAVFVVLAAVSAAWCTTLDLTTLAGQAHAYYGTDVRIQALALGVAAGVWTGHVGRGRALLKPKDARDVLDQGHPVVELLGWAGFLGSLIAFLTIDPLSPWMFSRGGMLLTTLAGVAWVIGCAQRRATLLVRLHSWRPIVYTGKISYGLYLYHWPIFLWLKRAFPDADRWPLAIATLVLAYAVSVVSYRYLERPVMRHGLKAFGLGRTKAAVAAVLTGILAGAAAISSGGVAVADPQSSSTPDYVADIPKLVAGQPAYRAPKPPVTVAMFGDSVPYFLVQRIPRKNFPGLELVNMGSPGCDLVDDPVQWSATQQQTDEGPCHAAKVAFSATLRRTHPSTLVIMPSLLAALHHDVGGKVLWLDSAVYRKRITDKLSQLTREARAAGVQHVLVSTVPCRHIEQLEVPEQYRDIMKRSPQLVAEAQRPMRLNGVITGWAHGAGVPVIDLATPICGSSPADYHPQVNGKTLYDDGIHFSPEASPMIWEWMAPQILTKAGHP